MMLKDGRELTIAKAVSGDAAEIVAYLNRVGGESENLTFGRDGFRFTVEEEARFIENINASERSALFVGRVEGVVVSVATIQSPNKERLAHQCDVGLSVRRDYWRLGIGEAMMRTLIGFARGTGTLEIVHLGVRADNVGAIALYRKLGFEEIGAYKGYFKVNGVYADEVLMNLYL